MTKNLLGAFLILMNTLIVYGQTEIQGIVRNKKGKALIGANVLVMQPNTHRILTYAISGKKGLYQLSSKHISDSLMLSVSFLGYKTKKVLISNHSQKLDFVLQASKQKLKEVIIKTQPVKVKGDTINYRVASLKQEEDKVLIDVIKRIPGVDVMTNGKIFYQGKPINRFYIENMDMLEGRYNLASNNLPVDQIASVQVYENHQPIKLLDSLVYSENAALNIRLKKSFSYALPYELAAGYQPVIWQGKFVPMIFRKKVQMLSLLQSNNAGQRLHNQLQNFYQSKTFEMAQQTQEWTHISNIITPPFDEDKWLDNQSYLGSLNFLFKLNETARLKTNFSYLPENIKETAVTRQQILLQDYPIIIEEHQQHTQNMRQAVWNMIYEQNSKKVYLKNNFHFAYQEQSDNSFVSNKDLSQQRNRPAYYLTNQTNWMFPLKKHIFSINTFFSYQKTDEDFVIKPGSFPQIFNNGLSFDVLQQSLQTQKWHFNLNTGWMKKVKNWTLENYVSVQNDRHFLKSKILPSESSSFVQSDFSNHTKFDKTTLENLVKINFRNPKSSWNLGFELPLRYIYLNVNDQSNRQSKQINGIFLDYDLTFKHLINKWSVIGSYSRKTVFNDLFQNHFNYILKAYNELERYRTPIQKSIKSDYSLIFRFKDILDGIHSSLSLSYTGNRRNILYKYKYFSNGASELEAIKISNQTQHKQVTFKFNKYFFKTKISTKFNIMFQWTKRPIILNEILLHKTYKSIHILSSIRIPIHKKLSFYTDFQVDNYFFANQKNNLKNYHIKSSIYYYPFKQHQLNLSFDYYLMPNEQRQDFFMNFLYKYTPKAKRWSVFAKWNNITGITSYTTYFGDAYNIYQSVYILRPSYVLIGFESSL